MTTIENNKGSRPVHIGLGANDNYRGWAVVHMPSDAVIREPETVHAIAVQVLRVWNEKRLSRRRVIDWLADTIYFYDGAIINADGTAWLIDEIDVDEPWGRDETFSWVGEMIRFATTMPQQRAHKGLVPRLRLFWLAVEITLLSEARRRAMFPPRGSA
jgi:hypothetical protein